MYDFSSQFIAIGGVQFDLVALLSCVGEDILLPDELSCPEYEITSDLEDRSKVQKNAESTLVFESAQVQSSLSSTYLPIYFFNLS